MSPPLSAASDLPPALRARIKPSLTGWMDWLCPQIDDAMLDEIALADYGYQADEHLAALRLIRDDWRIPDQVGGIPLEVLELVRWSQPDDPTWKPGGQGRRGHRMRLFCCAVMLAMADDARLTPYFEEEPTLLQFVGSAIVLGDAAVDAMLPLLCRRLPAITEDRPFFSLSLLLLAAARYRGAADGPLLAELCRLVVDDEARARAAQHPSLLREPWLLGLAFSADGDDAWRELAWRVLIEPAAPHPPAAVTALHDIGARLVLGEPDSPDGAPR